MGNNIQIPSPQVQSLSARAGNIVMGLARDDKPLNPQNVVTALGEANIPFWVVTPSAQPVNPADPEPDVVYVALVFEKNTLVTYVATEPGALTLGPEIVPSEGEVGDSLADPLADDVVTSSPSPEPSAAP